MFAVSQIDHCSVIITDVERSRRFYRDVLGLKEIPRPRTFDFVVLWFDLGNQHLHLLLKDRPDTISPRHFALRVADAAAARAYFRDTDIPIQETTPIPGADRFFISDPDGNRIEIIQWHSGRQSSRRRHPGRRMKEIINKFFIFRPCFPRSPCSAWNCKPRRSASRPSLMAPQAFTRDAERPTVRSHAEHGNEECVHPSSLLSIVHLGSEEQSWMVSEALELLTSPKDTTNCSILIAGCQPEIMGGPPRGPGQTDLASPPPAPPESCPGPGWLRRRRRKVSSEVW